MGLRCAVLLWKRVLHINCVALIGTMSSPEIKFAKFEQFLWRRKKKMKECTRFIQNAEILKQIELVFVLVFRMSLT